MFFLFLGAMLGLQKVTGYEHDKKTSVMILSFEIWPNMASESTSADSEGSVF